MAVLERRNPIVQKLSNKTAPGCFQGAGFLPTQSYKDTERPLVAVKMLINDVVFRCGMGGCPAECQLPAATC
jgi:hypothetical protein